jgi:predicted small secreted protein
VAITEGDHGTGAGFRRRGTAGAISDHVFRPRVRIQETEESTVTARRKLRFVLLVCGVLAAGIGLSACETVKGMGRDLQSLGRAVTGAAEDTQ